MLVTHTKRSNRAMKLSLEDAMQVRSTIRQVAGMKFELKLTWDVGGWIIDVLQDDGWVEVTEDAVEYLVATFRLDADQISYIA